MSVILFKVGEEVCLQGGLSLGGSVSRKVRLWGGLYPGGLPRGGLNPGGAVSWRGGGLVRPLRNQKSEWYAFHWNVFLFFAVTNSSFGGSYRVTLVVAFGPEMLGGGGDQ